MGVVAPVRLPHDPSLVEPAQLFVLGPDGAAGDVIGTPDELRGLLDAGAMGRVGFEDAPLDPRSGRFVTRGVLPLDRLPGAIYRVALGDRARRRTALLLVEPTAVDLLDERALTSLIGGARRTPRRRMLRSA
jgi:hypothetical protein